MAMNPLVAAYLADWPQRMQMIEEEEAAAKAKPEAAKPAEPEKRPVLTVKPRERT